MGEINIKNLTAGMVLATAIVNREGTTLLSAGTALTDPDLVLLEAQGVLAVDVEGTSEVELAKAFMQELDAEGLREAKAEMTELFQYTDRRHPFIDTLFQLSVINNVRNRRN